MTKDSPSPSGEDILAVQGLEAGYGEFVVFRDVNLHVRHGELVSIIGPNGAGKTTLLKSIVGAINPSKGRVLFEGEEITRSERGTAARAGIAFVPAGTGIFPNMTVAENIEAGGYVVNERAVVAERMTHALELFPRLKERLRSKASTLSGGERQMLLLSRALMLDPRVILMDEPSLGLDPRTQTALYSRIVSLNESGKSILLVEQNVERALQVSRRCYIMDAGKIVHEGAPAELKNMEGVREAYLGVASRPEGFEI